MVRARCRVSKHDPITRFRVDDDNVLAYHCIRSRESRADSEIPDSSRGKHMLRGPYRVSPLVNPIDPSELARISAALVKAMAEARVLHENTGVDEAFRENIRQARELHDLLLKGLIEAEPGPTEYLRGLCDSMGNNLDELEALVHRSLS